MENTNSKRQWGRIQKISKGLSVIVLIAIIISVVFLLIGLSGIIMDCFGEANNQIPNSMNNVEQKDKTITKLEIGEPVELNIFSMKYKYLKTKRILEKRKDGGSYRIASNNMFNYMFGFSPILDPELSKDEIVIRTRFIDPNYIDSNQRLLIIVNIIDLLLFSLILLYGLFSLHKLFSYYSKVSSPFDKKGIRFIRNILIAYLCFLLYGSFSVYIGNLLVSDFTVHIIQFPYVETLIFGLMFFIWWVMKEYYYLKEENDLTI